MIEVEEFPDGEQLSFFEVAENQVAFELSPQESFEQDYDVVVNWQEQAFPTIQHVFSHRKWQIRLLYGRVANMTKNQKEEQVLWLHPDDFTDYPFAKPQQKMWQTFQEGKLKGN